MTDDQEALRAARTALGGRPLDLATDEIFARLDADQRFFSQGIFDARRTFYALQIGIAVEALQKANEKDAKLVAMLRLARTLRRHLIDRRPGWFRFLIAFGRDKGESAFQIAITRRAHSSSAQPVRALQQVTRSGRAMTDMLIAGAILSRIEDAAVRDVVMSIEAAIGAAINDEEILTQEGAAQLAFQRFRKYCAELTGGGDTYRLQRYAGSIKKYQGRWVALPDTGAGVSHLPSPKGGRPRT